MFQIRAYPTHSTHALDGSRSVVFLQPSEDVHGRCCSAARTAVQRPHARTQQDGRTPAPPITRPEWLLRNSAAAARGHDGGTPHFRATALPAVAQVSSRAAHTRYAHPAHPSHTLPQSGQA
ncbi:hypothetical protein EON67_00110 [archaeon]|nr:MAG: hypothetical protein EON67_00110 [archaeon]